MPFAAFGADSVGKARGGGNSIEWQLSVHNHSAIEVLVLMPNGELVTRTFKGGQTPSIRVNDLGTDVEDGQYSYELRVVPNVPADVAKKLEKARAANDEAAARKVMREAGLSPVTQSGTFSVRNRSIVSTDLSEEGAEPAAALREEAGPQPVNTTPTRPGKVAVQDQVIPDDLIVQGSECVGFDCVADENFGFDTIRMKENNLRIKAEDTSTSSGFPTNDWQLTFNDSASGGANKFSVEDITSATVPLTITGAAPSNSVFVASNGKVGFRNSTPVLDLHVTTGDTPAQRFEQTSAGGFTAQTWDVAGNEANWFVRDVTGGSRLPFRIRPGAPTSSIDISNDGDVGFETASPEVALDLRAPSATDNHFLGIGTGPLTGQSLNIGYAGAVYGRSAAYFNVRADASAVAPNPSMRFAIGDSVKVIIDNQGYLGLGPGVTNPTTPIQHESGATLTTAGVWTSVSSREKKQDITDLTTNEAFEALQKLQPVKFAYKVEPTDQQVGFIAEDVPEIVAQPDHKTLNSLEIVAVLTKVVQEQQKTIEELTKKVEELSASRQQ